MRFDKEKTKARRRLIFLEQVGDGSSKASDASETQAKLAGDADDQAGDADAVPPLKRPSGSAQKCDGLDDADDMDATLPFYSDDEFDEVDCRDS